MEEFPSNSHKSKAGPVPAKVVSEKPKADKPEQIATGKIRQKSLGVRLKEALFGGESIKTVGENVLFEVLIPSAKEMVTDAFIEAISRKFGTNTGRRLSRTVAAHSSGPIAYNRFSQSTTIRTREESTRPPMGRARSGYEVEDIGFDTRAQASRILDEMCARLQRYGAVSVMDYYDMVGQSGTHVDEKWGWTNFNGIGVGRAGRDFVITLPPAEPLD